MWLIQGAMQGWHHNGHYMGIHWGWWIFWLLVLVVLVWALVRYLPRDPDRGRDTETGESAEEILRQRFSRGELDEVEFAEMMRTLRESRGS